MQTYLKKSLKNLRTQILNTVFPISCLDCRKPDIWLCDDCLDKIELQANPLLTKTKETRCLDKIISACHYKNSLLQKVIPAFKYKFALELEKPLSKILIHTLKKFDIPRNTILIPVPLHKKRFNSRGFNQAELCARNIAKYFDIPIEVKAVLRTKNTKHQARLSREDRLKNLNQAFVCKNSELIKNKNIILIDDVSTTGATLNHIARILKTSGAKSVWGLVIAHE